MQERGMENFLCTSMASSRMATSSMPGFFILFKSSVIDISVLDLEDASRLARAVDKSRLMS